LGFNSYFFKTKEAAMIIEESDLFQGLGPEIIHEIGKNTIQESHEKGSFIIKERQVAEHLYVLEEGEIRLSVGEKGRITHLISNAGETFGWSSLVDRETYTASAECLASSKVIRIEKEKLNKIFEDDPASGMLFFKRLAGMIGERLVNSYSAILSAYEREGPPSYG
jgi:CRP-like cAMP-binding protein